MHHFVQSLRLQGTSYRLEQLSRLDGDPKIQPYHDGGEMRGDMGGTVICILERSKLEGNIYKKVATLWPCF